MMLIYVYRMLWWQHHERVGYTDNETGTCYNTHYNLLYFLMKARNKFVMRLEWEYESIFI